MVVSNPRTPMANGTSFLDVRSPGVNFLRKVNKFFSLWRGRLQTPSMASIGWRGHRVRFPPDVQHFSRKCQHPPTNILGRTFRPPWVFCVLGLYRKNGLWDTKFAANNVQKGEYGSIGKKLALRYSFWRNWVSGRRIFHYRPILFRFCFLPIPKSIYREIYLL